MTQHNNMCNPDQSSAIIRMAMIDLLLVNPPNRKKDQKYVNLVIFGRLVKWRTNPALRKSDYGHKVVTKKNPDC